MFHHKIPRSALTVAALAVVTGIGTSAPPVQAQTNVTSGYSCAGRPATIVSAAAVIVGTPYPDVIVAVGIGNNTIFGYAANDVICAGPGNDVIYGGTGNDYVLAGTGNDYVFGEDGGDILYGESGDDRMYGHRGNDAVYGGPGRDLVVGNAGSDWLRGNDDDDQVDAVLDDDGSPDSAFGDGGADRVKVGPDVANDVGDGGATLLDVCSGDPGELVNCP